MREVPSICIVKTNDSVIQFREKRSKICFNNAKRKYFKRVQVDGCAIKEGLRCDNLLCSEDEHDEYYIELKGSDIAHAISQLRNTITQIGQYDYNRHSYIVCTKFAPQLSTKLQIAKKYFKSRFKSDLIVKGTPMVVDL